MSKRQLKLSRLYHMESYNKRCSGELVTTANRGLRKNRNPGQRQSMDCYIQYSTFLNEQSHGEPAASSPSTAAKLGKRLRTIGNLAQTGPE